jgi:hypothetical protein
MSTRHGTMFGLCVRLLNVSTVRMGTRPEARVACFHGTEKCFNYSSCVCLCSFLSSVGASEKLFFCLARLSRNFGMFQYSIERSILEACFGGKIFRLGPSAQIYLVGKKVSRFTRSDKLVSIFLCRPVGL